MFRNRSVEVHQFSMIPRGEIPRSRFRMQTTHKTTFNSGRLIPVFLEEVVPGDTFSLRMTAFARLATPIVPIMDNLWLESFFFFVPTRLVWKNFVKMMGEQTNPGDSISYTVPTMACPANGYSIHTIGDYFGLPTVGQVAVGQGGNILHSALPIRGFWRIFNEWFRDENLMVSAPAGLEQGDGPDVSTGVAEVACPQRGKRHDYFTSCLPFLQKGSAVTLPLGTDAPVKTRASDSVIAQANPVWFKQIGTGNPASNSVSFMSGGTPTPGTLFASTTAATAQGSGLYPANLYADLSAATSATINALRLSVQTQRFLEKDARGGTRYTELVSSHFGVKSPDARLQRPEYLGGGSTPVNISPVAQTSNTGATGTPQGNLSAFGTAVAQGHGFRQSFTEHGYIIGIMNVRGDMTYQQGMRRLWSRSTRYDFYWPVFAMLGEQAVLNREIYCDGTATDSAVFGYQERWGEMRHHPSRITGLFRSTAAGTLDVWHLAQRFTAVPTLNSVFISEAPPVNRVIAVPSQPEFLCDMFFDVMAARPMPMYSIPGHMDHL